MRDREKLRASRVGITPRRCTMGANTATTSMASWEARRNTIWPRRAQARPRSSRVSPELFQESGAGSADDEPGAASLSVPQSTAALGEVLTEGTSLGFEFLGEGWKKMTICWDNTGRKCAIYLAHTP